MSEAIQAVIEFVKIHLRSVQVIFQRFYNGGYEIFGVPFYVWILILLIVGYIIDVVGDMLGE